MFALSEDYPIKAIHIKQALNGQWYSVVTGHNNHILFDSGETYRNWDDCYDIIRRTWPEEFFPQVRILTNGKAIEREHPNHSREESGRPL